MAFPIVALRLVPQKCVERVGFFGERALRGEVVAEAYEKHALTPLRYAIVSGIEHAYYHAVMQVCANTACVVTLQPREVVGPIFALTRGHVGMFELQADVLEVVAKRDTG